MMTRPPSDLGYRVLAAHNAREALQILKGSERIDLLFSDIVMPGGINGVQLATEARRFRPNVVVQLANGEKGFAEDNWVGHTVTIGTEVQLNITRQCGRCVMTTLAQGDLPKDPGILRTAAEHNRAKIGVYASVVRGGKIRRGDRVSIE